MNKLIKFSLTIILGKVTYLFKLISEPLHDQYFPLPLLPFIHAARLSLVYQHLRLKAGGKLSWTSDLIGYLVMAWGGSVMVNLILYQPIPQLSTFRPLIIYSFTHWSLKLIGFSPSMAFLDRLLPLPDALIRTATITSAVDLVTHHREPAYAQSLLLQLIMGAIAASGGSTLAQSFGTTQLTWRLARPDWMERPNTLGALDLWSGVLIAFVYGILQETHPIYHSLSNGFNLTFLTPIEARGICGMLLCIIYYWRAHQTYGNLNHQIKKVNQVTIGKKKD
ncbi:hypothetical protein DFH28DRAFT_14491 [Melampsora americana]|nr:hypothetical protein DFH28DRAFT_14491 [Melampsora americana]